MKWFKYLLWTLFAGVVFYYLVVLGGPIRNLIELRGCSVGYTHYLSNNVYGNWLTPGRYPTNEVTLTNARREVANCLCDNAGGQQVEARELIGLIQLDPMLSSSFERLQQVQGRPLDSVEIICAHRNTLFAPLYIE